MFNNKIASLTRRSQNIVKSLTTMVADLHGVNDEIAVERAKKVAKIAKVQEDITDLDTQAATNNTLIGNLTKLFQ